MKSSDGGNTWTPETRITNTPGSTRGAQLESDSNGLHLVYFEYVNESINYRIFYQRSVDEGDNWHTWTGV